VPCWYGATSITPPRGRGGCFSTPPTKHRWTNWARCTARGAAPAPGDTLVAPGSGLPAPSSDDDVVTAALARPHLLLSPVR
jgi:hypothetical protein